MANFTIDNTKPSNNISGQTFTAKNTYLNTSLPDSYTRPASKWTESKFAHYNTRPIIYGYTKELAGLPLPTYGGTLMYQTLVGNVTPCVTETAHYRPEAGGVKPLQGTASTIVKQKDGKILFGGIMSTYNGVPTGCATRLEPDGSLDTSFNPPRIPDWSTGANGVVYTIKQQPDEKILLGGQFTQYNLTNANGICRLHQDGSLDTTFNAVLPSVSSSNAIVVQKDGKIVVGGVFNSSVSVNGTTLRRLWRLYPDGSFDTSFKSGGNTGSTIGANIGPSLQVSNIIEQPTGKMVISGNFSSYNGVSVGRICRIEEDGSLDISFNRLGLFNGSGANGVILDMAVQSDGKIIIVGQFTTFNGINFNRVCRLDADGKIDDSFDIGSGATVIGVGGSVTSVAVDDDDNIYLSCGFTIWDDIPVAHPSAFIRLHPDGTLDETFDAGVCANVILPEKDGRILAAGGYGHISGLIARYNHDGSYNPHGSTSLWNSKKIEPDVDLTACRNGFSYNGTSARYIRNSLSAKAIREGKFNLNTGEFDVGFPEVFGDYQLTNPKINTRPIYLTGGRPSNYRSYNELETILYLAPTNRSARESITPYL